MSRTTAALVLAVLAALPGTGALAAGSATRTSFADGRWSGSTRLSTSLSGIALNATGAFTLEVKGGRVASGTLTLSGTASGSNQGSKVTANITGQFPLSGPATRPAGRGSLVISALVKGKIQKLAAPVLSTLSGVHGTCDRVSGQVVIKSPQAQTGSAPNSVKAPFVATRAAGSGPSC